MGRLLAVAGEEESSLAAAQACGGLAEVKKEASNMSFPEQNQISGPAGIAGMGQNLILTATGKGGRGQNLILGATGMPGRGQNLILTVPGIGGRGENLILSGPGHPAGTQN